MCSAWRDPGVPLPSLDIAPLSVSRAQEEPGHAQLGSPGGVVRRRNPRRRAASNLALQPYRVVTTPVSQINQPNSASMSLAVPQ